MWIDIDDICIIDIGNIGVVVCVTCCGFPVLSLPLKIKPTISPGAQTNIPGTQQFLRGGAVR